MANKPIRSPKKLIVCCDGTWMNSDNGWVDATWFKPGHYQTPSNVTRISRAILPEDKDHHPQIVYYQAGVGTSSHTVDRWFSGGTGAGLSENIREAYAFVANNFHPGDSIFLLGFSRGAFTARSIGGLIAGMGLLEKDGLEFFYCVFKDWEGAGDEDYEPSGPTKIPGWTTKLPSPKNANNYLREYKKELKRLKLARDAAIKAIGVWDTVGALGIPTTPILQKIGFPDFLHDYKFLDTGIDNHVENAFQALALDEHRASYSPAVWERPEGCSTNLKQVWFPGVHSNVGGSYEDSSIADITLSWMMSQLAPWLAFNPNYLRSQHAALQTYLKTTENPKRGWANGKIYNSNEFPTSLGGSEHRTPCMYHKTDYGTQRPLPDMLRETNEMVHLSVRLRYRDPKSMAYNDYRVGYRPPALKGWNCEDGDAFSDDGIAEDSSKVKWVYLGDKKEGKGKIMLEDKLGEFELELLNLDSEAASKVLD
ncbi:hypothetical protein M501DRAFT_994577 [Patellaria atrata CBS 101060]|uniref:T6SS Phospholipase effector Tle1-like catalytic domain-containing protein n=1 Tax=Patellaria atrata CBS 101060 TaxID=1346257 RepID=A0A9P4VS44_9PEZI|nr:hypothetical protein M501DRAFT_994577 [Patellaria atrata CBS 101060]